jgi:hypothetical protein
MSSFAPEKRNKIKEIIEIKLAINFTFVIFDHARNDLKFASSEVIISNEKLMNICSTLHIFDPHKLILLTCSIRMKRFC